MPDQDQLNAPAAALEQAGGTEHHTGSLTAG